MAHPVEKYLDRYAEPESRGISGMDFQPCDYALVIPACREQPADVERVWKEIPDVFLVILVVNSSRENEAENLSLLRHIHSRFPPTVQRGNLSLHPAHPYILLVDRCTTARTIPDRQGVGLARKIGADIALRLMTDGIVRTPVIFSTDADVQLPPDYFRSPRAGAAATLYPFRHKPDPGLELPATLYEIFMLYYVTGLKRAGSPWAFTTIGSTMAVGGNQYAMVRGFPRRSAGEDFYLLNKLAKTGEIRQLAGPTLTIAARRSSRVPFGTGTSLEKIAAMDDPAATFTFYDPEIFRTLARWLEVLSVIRDDGDPRHYLDASPQLKSWCDETGALYIVRDRRRTLSRQVFNNFLREWFDAFRTLKFVHYMRDRFYPSIPLNGITGTEFTPQLDSLSSFRDQLATICFEEPPGPVT